MVKVEAVVVRERVETVIDAVEEQTGHVGVIVVEAIGHGRQRGITHEYVGLPGAVHPGPGGYGTESHGHLGGAHRHELRARPATAAEPALESP